MKLGLINFIAEIKAILKYLLILKRLIKDGLMKSWAFTQPDASFSY
jgi:hypothetical protein